MLDLSTDKKMDFSTITNYFTDKSRINSQGEFLADQNLFESECFRNLLNQIPTNKISLKNVAITNPSTDYPKILTIRADTPQVLFIPNNLNMCLQDIKLSFIFTQNNPTAYLTMQVMITSANLFAQNKTITSAQFTLPVVGRLLESSELQLKMVDGASNSEIQFTNKLTDIVDIITNNKSPDFLQTAFDKIKLSNFELIYELAAKATTVMTMECEIILDPSGWSLLASPNISLKELSVCFYISLSFDVNNQPISDWGWRFDGKANLVNSEICVYLYPDTTTSSWIINISPPEKNNFPDFMSALDWSFGSDIKQKISNAFQMINNAAFKINAISCNVSYKDMSLNSLQINSDFNINEYLFSLDCLLPDASVLASFPVKQSNDPSITNKISLKTFVESIYPQLQCFPDLKISSVILNIDPNDSSIYFGMSIDENWIIDLTGNHTLVLENVNFNFTKSSTSELAGGCSATIKFCNADFIISATSQTQGWLLSAILTSPAQLDGFFNDLCSFFNFAPIKLFTIDIWNLNFEVNTFTKDLNFAGSVGYDDTKTIVHPFLRTLKADILLNTKMDNGNRTYEFKLDGSIFIGDSKFQITLSSNTSSSQSSILIQGNWVLDATDTPLGLNNLINTLEINLDLPSEFDIALKSANFSYDLNSKYLTFTGSSINYGNFGFSSGLDTNQKRWFAFIVQVNSITCPALPLVNMKADIKNLIISITTMKASISIPNLYQGELEEGINLKGDLYISGEEPKSLGVKMHEISDIANTPTVPSTLPASSVPPQKPPLPSWIPIQKNVGPFFLDRVGISYENKCVSILFDGALISGQFKLVLNDLSLSFPLSDITKISADLKGLSVQAQTSTLKVGGGLYKNNGAYSGIILISAANFEISASAIYDNDHLLCYGIMGADFGGPPSFRVKGIALGFGYNTAIKLPALDEIAQYPLIVQADTNTNDGSGNTTIATKLQDILDPLSGETFLALGVKFSSFQMIDSFALITAQFGNSTKFNLLGISTVKLPEEDKSAKPIVLATLALDGSINPDIGIASFNSQLTSNSYIFQETCHLTGGFAFYNWFSKSQLSDEDHSGDFVVTLGGYHPKFVVPNHYPKIQRLEINWPVSPTLGIKGQAYFALTPSCIMAGGELEILYQSGELRAWCKAQADFLLAWQPYFYSISLSVDFGVSYTFNFIVATHITIDVSADLQINGPPFSGSATINLSIISFTINFGVECVKPNPLNWTDFNRSFLSQGNKFEIKIVNGLIRDCSKDIDLKIDAFINPNTLVIEMSSLIPSKQAKFNGKSFEIAESLFGIYPMGIPADEFSSLLDAKVIKVDDNAPIDDAFEKTIIRKNIPKALWGHLDKNHPQSDADVLSEAKNGTINNVIVGIQLKAKTTKPDQSPSLLISELLTATTYNPHFNWLPSPKPHMADGDQSDANQKWIDSLLNSPSVDQQRQALLIAANSYGIKVNEANWRHLKEGSSVNYYNSAPYLCKLGE